MLSALVQRERPPGAEFDTRGRDEQGPGRARRLCCAACRTAITEESARTEIAGAHRHVFVNPHGHVFEVGCFTHAPGAGAIGQSTAFFSWFPGYTWRVAVCTGCRAHLGWCYGDGPDFVGLILPRLVEGEAD